MLVVLAAAFGPAQRTAGQTPAPLAIEDYEGEYRFVGGARDRRGLELAIDRVVDQMNIFVREIARGEIRGRVQPEQTIRLEVDGLGRLRLALDAWGPNTVSLDGRARRVRGPDGSDTRLSARFARGRLRVSQVNPQGRRDSVLALSPDREHLTMRVRIAADQLPDDLRYALHYRKR